MRSMLTFIAEAVADCPPLGRKARVLGISRKTVAQMDGYRVTSFARSILSFDACGALLVLLVGVVVAASAMAESSTVKIVPLVLSTDPVPGGNGTFYSLGAPSINRQGAVAFGDGFGSAIYSNARGYGLGPLKRVVRQGDIPPGVVGSFGAVYEPSLNDDGSMAFRAEGQDSCDRGIYLFEPPRTVKLIADASTKRPGAQETFALCGPSIPVGNNNGQIVFADGTSTTQGVYRADVSRRTGVASLSEIVVLEDGFEDVGNGGNPHSLNDLGAAALVLQRPDFTYAVYAAPPKGGSLKLIAQPFDPAPGGGAFTTNIGGAQIGNANQIAFFAGTQSGVGIYVATPRGVLSKLVDSSDSVPGHPDSKFVGFGNMKFVDNNNIVFQASYRLGRISYQGLYLKSGTGPIKVIFDQFDGVVVKGQHLDLVDSARGRTLDMFLDARFASRDWSKLRVAFVQRLPKTTTGGTPSGIFVALCEFDSRRGCR